MNSIVRKQMSLTWSPKGRGDYFAQAEQLLIAQEEQCGDEIEELFLEAESAQVDLMRRFGEIKECLKCGMTMCARESYS